jgi:hypothetical protein
MLGIGLVAGRASPAETVDRNYALIQEFIKRFEQQFGTTNCRALLGCDLGTPEGQRTFQANRLIEHCLDYAEAAARIAIRYSIPTKSSTS